MFTFLENFISHKPPFQASQEESLAWLLEAHVKAGGNRAELVERFQKIACKPGVINTRSYYLPDFSHRNWQEMRLFNLEKERAGANLQERMAFYREVTEKVIEEFYERETTAPDHLLHATCTGYVAPSSPQRVVSRRGWGAKTTVTHLYHMGCYSAIPAIRIGEGYLQKRPRERVDLVHTEICTIHQNPLDHAPHQVALQSLFADGCIKYSMTTSKPEGKGYRVIDTYEELLEGSLDKMIWDISPFGFYFFLAKEIPVIVLNAIQGYLKRLFQRMGLEAEKVMKSAHFAIHPGGPKILDYIQRALKLSDEQLSFSRKILASHGNISSATLPSIWKEMLNEVSRGTQVVSLAFGPGLTVAGALLEVV